MLLAGALLAAGCAPALREPPALPDPASAASGLTPAEVDRLLEEADEQYRRWIPESVSRSERLSVRATEADPERVGAWTGTARARVWRANKAETAEERREAAESAVHAAQSCERVAPDDAACAYWLAIALGVQARERRATALDALPIMVRLLERAIELDERLDHGGPHRVLSLVYLRAPGWPTGPGDPDLGLEYASRAVEIDPGHPPNRLCLAEALSETGDPDGALDAYLEAERGAAAAAEAGMEEAREWLDEARQGIDSGG
jgi:tetratricopeptide (TPR) repeat protein